MSDFVNYLQHRVEETKRKVQETTDRMNQAMAERQMLVDDLAGYERALSAEMREQGIKFPAQAIQMPLDGTGTGTENGTGNRNGDGTNTGETSKAEFARQFVRGHADAGVTPNDIFKGFQDAGIPIKKPYIYALVQRLQKQTAIRSRRGKWYPIPESERPASGDAEKSSALKAERPVAAGRPKGGEISTETTYNQKIERQNQNHDPHRTSGSDPRIPNNG